MREGQTEATSPAPDATATTPYLLVRAANRTIALRLEDLAEVMRPMPTEPVPDMPEMVRGLAVIRGAAHAVVDLRLLLGGDATRPPRRFVRMSTSDPALALAVDEVIGLRDLSPNTMESDPEPIHGLPRETVAALGTLGRTLLLVLRGARLLSDEVVDGLRRAIRGDDG